jgi:hypothetical protein
MLGTGGTEGCERWSWNTRKANKERAAGYDR